MKYLEKHHLDEETIKQIGCMSILWSQFECFLSLYDAKFQTAFNYFCANKIKVTEEFLAVYYDFRKAICDYLIDVNENTIKNRIFSKENCGNSETRAAVYQFLTDDTSISVFGCYITVRRIRDNYIHGLKDIYNLNSQYTIFKYASDLLEYALCSIEEDCTFLPVTGL